MGQIVASVMFLFYFVLVIYAVYKSRKNQDKLYKELVEREKSEREKDPTAFERDNEQVWVEYMGMRLPFYRFELHRWKAMSTDEKKTWVKQLKSDLKAGKKVAIKENGVVVGYRVKDKKTIQNEQFREKVYKKVNNL